MSIIGAMMFLVGVNLARYILTLRVKDWVPAGVTVAVALGTNMAVGFVTGMVVYFGVKYFDLCR